MIATFNESAGDSKRVIEMLMRNNEEYQKELNSAKEVWSRKITQSEAEFQTKIT